MTATLVARMVEKGEVEWDDNVGDLLFDLVPDLNLDLGDATFLHLLSHHAGQQTNIDTSNFGSFGQRPEDPIADRLKWARLALTQDAAGRSVRTSPTRTTATSSRAPCSRR